MTFQKMQKPRTGWTKIFWFPGGPRYLIWPERTGNNGFWLFDVARNQYHNLCQATSIRNLGLEHFYAAFGLGCSRNLRTSSARAFGISDKPETIDTWHSLRNSHTEKSQGNRGTTSGGGKRGKQSELLWFWGTLPARIIQHSWGWGYWKWFGKSWRRHYYSDLRQYSATLERDVPAHYTTQQLNTQEWGFWWWPRRHSKVSLAPYYLAPCKTYVPY